jgi:N-acylglucosamine-6-phosphate 2-epimerase
MSNISILNSLKGELIVSCQAEGLDPFNTPEYVTLFALAAKMGGARGIRSEGIDKIQSIKGSVDLPIIGLLKDYFDDGFVRITGSFKMVENLIDIGCDIIAIDGTFRKREGLTGPKFIEQVKYRYSCIVLADIATDEEAIASKEAGADCVSTTLSGYTPETQFRCDSPDFNLIKRLSQTISIPVFAEGRINTPQEAKKAMDIGAYAVIVGSAITRPRIITSWFANKIKNK